MKILFFLVTLAMTFAFGWAQSDESSTPSSSSSKGDDSAAKLEKATFAGGCFWCMEPPFEKLEGVEKVTSGYSGGKVDNPTYEQVTTGKTGHTEAVQILYDPLKITYDDLLEVFWKNIDPTDSGGQFADRGSQYRTAIFYHDATQKQLAAESKKRLDESDKFDRPIITEITEFTNFFPAENYHQDYYKKFNVKYNRYKKFSGRESFLEKTWDSESAPSVEEKLKNFKKPADKELKKSLTPLQYGVTQKEGTERPFNNQYWDNKKEGIYVDIVSGEPLFSSLDKFESGCGWPSFTKPLEPGNIQEKTDRKLSMPRTEVRSKHADSHLGHVFGDGPQPTGLRYCINSAALRFIPKEDLEKEGYGDYLILFKN